MRANRPAERGKIPRQPVHRVSRSNVMQEKDRMGQGNFSSFAYAASPRGANSDGNENVTIHQCRIGLYDVRAMSYLTNRGGLGACYSSSPPTVCVLQEQARA